ncbi:MAG: hypothetical protein DRG59_00335 [Deltaproteobacteria bacterium]|nr:MAG: hypothetical protein DRG83_02095 [Deltaproteobacteria bacterium]RLB10149.1 MAG: hypothetical protein DRG59_00335 [Deltaproteobacteria bacterium]HEC32204.1 hypothetical protein [Deltaproteobacteria bacterium]
MKLLMFYAPEFWFKTYQKVLQEVDDVEVEKKVINTVVIFFHAEPSDMERMSKVITKFVKNAKWLAGKFKTKSVVLHSFNHLSPSKAPPEIAIKVVEEVRQRLERTNYEVIITPFGYLNEWRIHVAGESLAKVFKEI